MATMLCKSNTLSWGKERLRPFRLREHYWGIYLIAADVIVIFGQETASKHTITPLSVAASQERWSIDDDYDAISGSGNARRSDSELRHLPDTTGFQCFLYDTLMNTKVKFESMVPLNVVLTG